MDAPQSTEELAPIVAAIRAIDPLLDIRWNPRAVVVAYGSYDAEGNVKPAVYDGRWQIIRYESATTLHPDRGERSYTVLTNVTEQSTHGGIPCMLYEGPYAPVDWRVVDFLQNADAANVQAFRERQRRLAVADMAVTAGEDAIDEDGALAMLDRQHFNNNYRGGVGNWQGRGADFAPADGG